MQFPKTINVIVDMRHKNQFGEAVVTQNDTGAEFLVSVVAENGQSRLPEDVSYVLTSLHLRRQPSQKLGVMQPDGNVLFRLGADELSDTGTVQAVVQAYHPTEGRVSSPRFIYHVAPDPLYAAEIKPADRSLFEVVLGEGPPLLEETKKEIQRSIDERARLTGAVGGALNSLAQDKAEALQEMASAKSSAEDATGEAYEAAAYTDNERQRLVTEVSEKITEVDLLKDSTVSATASAEAAAALANEEAEAARLQKEEVAEVLGAGPVASINGKTGQVTGIAEQAQVDQLTQQLADKADVREVRKKSVPISLDDTDSEFIAAIQNKEGETTFNLLSVPRNRSVSPQKTDFAEKVILSTNLYNPDTVNAGFNINGNDGSLLANELYNTSDYIEVSSNTTYSVPYPTRIAQYDESKNFIGYVEATSITTDENARYVRVRITESSSIPFIFNEGDTTMPWEPYEEGVLIEKLKLDESRLQDTLFEDGKLKEYLKVTEDNPTFLYRDSPNLFDKKVITPNYRLSNTNNIIVDANNTISDFIPVEENSGYSVTEGSYTHFYDESKQFISGHGVGLTTFTTPPGTAYIRITVRKVRLDTFMLVKGSEVPSTYVPFEVYSFTSSIKLESFLPKFQGKTWNVLGDSITADNNAYWRTVAGALGISKVNNYGVGGTSITPRSGDWHDNAMSLRYVEMDDNADIITVLGGVNDNPGAYDMPGLGTMDDRDTNSFYGACHVLFSGLIEKYPTKIIAVFTPIPRASMLEPNVNLRDRVRIIKEVAAYYALPCLDLFSNSQLRPFNEVNKDAYMPDGLHPNAEGHKLLAEQMIPFMKAL